LRYITRIFNGLSTSSINVDVDVEHRFVGAVVMYDEGLHPVPKKSIGGFDSFVSMV
jgi:hypothetical protein